MIRILLAIGLVLLPTSQAFGQIDPSAQESAFPRLLNLHANGGDAAEISALKAALDAQLYAALDPVEAGTLGPPPPYDGDDDSVIWTIRASGMADIDVPGAPAIPCAVVLMRPKLIEATEPMFGSTRDSFLPFVRYEDCPLDDWPGQELAKLFEAAEAAKYLDDLGVAQGTIRYSIWRRQALDREQLTVDPRALLGLPEPPTKEPFAMWSWLSPGNRPVQQHILQFWEPALSALAEHYRGRGFSEEEAEQAARRGLFQAAQGAACADRPIPPILRGLLVEGVPDDDIRAFLRSTPRPDRAAIEQLDLCARRAGGRDPLLHIAVARPALLEDIQRVTEHMTPEEQEDLDLEVHPEHAVNNFGKTPLMAAAQQNSLAAVEWLLNQGVTVDARTGWPELWDRAAPRYRARTALMYAAAEASLPVIRRLIEAGADTSARDSFGNTALDYLEGRGPVPMNPRLTADEREVAAQMLRPVGQGVRPEPVDGCTLRNAELCGDWLRFRNAIDSVPAWLLGHEIKEDYGDPQACTIVEETRKDERVTSVLDCSLGPVDDRSMAFYYGFSSDRPGYRLERRFALRLACVLPPEDERAEECADTEAELWMRIPAALQE